MVRSLGRLGVGGAKVDWTGYYQGEQRHRVVLPTYPFERQRYWVEAGGGKAAAATASSAAPLQKKPDVADWFYVPSWKRSALPHFAPDPSLQGVNVMVFLDELGLGMELSMLLRQAGHTVVEVLPGESFTRESHSRHIVRPDCYDDYDALLKDLASRGQSPQLICHLWMVTAGRSGEAKLQERGFYSLLSLA